MTTIELLETAEEFATTHDMHAEFVRQYVSLREVNGIEFSAICALQKIGLFDSFFKEKMQHAIQRTQILS